MGYSARVCLDLFDKDYDDNEKVNSLYGLAIFRYLSNYPIYGTPSAFLWIESYYVVSRTDKLFTLCTEFSVDI